jgi:hypothetical protein
LDKVKEMLAITVERDKIDCQSMKETIVPLPHCGCDESLVQMEERVYCQEPDKCEDMLSPVLPEVVHLMGSRRAIR